MVTALDTAAASPYAALLTVTWGVDHTALYTSADVDITIGADTYVSVPRCEIEFEKQHGGVEESPVRLTISNSSEVPPFYTLSLGFAHSDVYVTIEECSTTDPAGTRRTLWVGKIEGKCKVSSKWIEVPIISHKARLKQVILGVPATPTCPFIFGDDATCQKDTSADVLTLKIQTKAVNDRQTRIKLYNSSPDDVTVEPARYRDGYIQHDNLRIQIREVINTELSSRFELARVPPPGWAKDAVVTLHPGCDGRISTCRDIHDNESHFGGIGIAIPATNPIFRHAGPWD